MALSFAEDPTRASADRVRRSTAVHLNEDIERLIDSNVQSYVNSSRAAILDRIRELDEEWDVERVLEVNASTLALSGLVLGVTVNKKWLALPAVVLPAVTRIAPPGRSHTRRNRSREIFAESFAGQALSALNLKL